ncbi:MAG: DUF4139 domain-containing protein [Limnochordia bacterium]|nr:DUF4139 domain-containing protein [Limnochordia bacterium]
MKYILAFLVVALVSGCIVEIACAGELTTDLTIFSDNLGLIKQMLSVPATGAGDEIVLNVSKQIIVDSVHLELANGTAITKQWYSDDLANYSTLLQCYLGKDVLLRFEEEGTIVTKKVKLIRADPGFTVLLDHDTLLTNPSGTIIFPLDDGLVLEPGLHFVVAEQLPDNTQGNLNYLTRGLSWSAYYDVILSTDETTADITARAELANQCGYSFVDATVRLVAGKLNRTTNRTPALQDAVMLRDVAAGAMYPEAERFFEYYIYDLPSAITLEHGGRVYVAFLRQQQIPVKKSFVLARRGALDASERDLYTILTLQGKQLDKPLPAGAVRIYKEGTTFRELIGEDAISHIPSGDDVQLTVGTPYDIRTSKKILNQSSHSEMVGNLKKTVSTYEISITIENFKDEEILVTVPENMQWENYQLRVQSEHPMRKVDRYLVEFDVPVAAKDKSELLYTVETVTIR